MQVRPQAQELGLVRWAALVRGRVPVRRRLAWREPPPVSVQAWHQRQARQRGRVPVPVQRLAEAASRH